MEPQSFQPSLMSIADSFHTVLWTEHGGGHYNSYNPRNRYHESPLSSVMQFQYAIDLSMRDDVYGAFKFAGLSMSAFNDINNQLSVTLLWKMAWVNRYDRGPEDLRDLQKLIDMSLWLDFEGVAP